NWQSVRLQNGRFCGFESLRPCRTERSEREFAPAKLLGCPPLVTIGTAHIALGDLGGDSRPTAVPNQAADVHDLVGAIAMVEMRDQDVALATVDTRVSKQVLDDALDICGDVFEIVSPGGGDVCRPVALVMLTVPGVLTLAAERMAPADRAVFEVELGC